MRYERLLLLLLLLSFLFFCFFSLFVTHQFASHCLRMWNQIKKKDQSKTLNLHGSSLWAYSWYSESIRTQLQCHLKEPYNKNSIWNLWIVMNEFVVSQWNALFKEAIQCMLTSTQWIVCWIFFSLIFNGWTS